MRAHSVQHAEDWRSIKDDFRVFTAQSQAFFVLFDQLKPVDGMAGEDAVKQAGDRYRDICRRLFRHMAEFLAASLLMVDASKSRIQSRLENIGLRIPQLSCPQIPIGAFLFMGVVMMLAILSIVAIVRPASGPMPLPLTALLIGLTKTIGVVSAVLPKIRWAWFRPDSNNRPPYLAWIASATLAVLVSFGVERLAFGILDHKIFPLSTLSASH